MKAWFIALLAAALVARAENPKMITILHTNDIHGHIRPWTGWEGELAGKTIGGFDRIAAVVKQVRAETPNVLLLDAGDVLGDTMVADLTRGRALLQLMNAVGYDGLTIGNHEPDFTTAELRKWIADAKFPVLAANVTDRTSGQLFTKPFVVREVGGVKVGILGLAYPNTPLTTGKKNVEDLEFGPAAEAAQRFIPEMKKAGAQIIIALTHLGLGADKKLAEAVPQIDVIVGGHSHNRMTAALQIGRTLIVQAGAHGSDVGRLDLTIIDDGRIAKHERRLVTLDHATVPSDNATAELIDEIEKPYRAQLDEVIGEAAALIPRAQTLAGQEARKRDEASPVDHLFAEILRETTGSDIALLPGVGYGVALQPGPITAEHLRNLLPHDGKVVTMKLPGAQLRELLEQSLTNIFSDDPKTKVGGMIQTAGIQFTYEAEAKEGSRLGEVTVGNKPLDPARSYSVVTNSMLAHGGHNYRTFLEGTEVREHESQYETIKAAIRKRGHVDAAQTQPNR